nr:retrovirus-related Pol polyprotein from transposon TNT 1-94 [Tanacetum cinerariifolium]
MDHLTPTLAKIPILDIGKFKQWQFRIQQYLQHEHYALWEVIEFGDSYVAPKEGTATDSAGEGTATKKGRTVQVQDCTRTMAAILKTFGGNEATKKTKKNLLKQQYGNFKAEGSETLKQTFNRLQIIISQLEFMDIKIEQDDVNQKFLTSLAPKWLMHIIMWRNRSDLDTMSLDDLYNHLKVYESEVQKKSESNLQNIAFISSAKNSSGKEEVNTASIPTARTNVSPISANIGAVSISQDTACAYIASQSNDRYWKRTRKKITIQGTDVAGFDKSKVECFNCHKMSHFAREYRAPMSQDRGRRDNYRQGSKVEEQAPKALMAIDGVGWDWSFMANEEEYHALVANEEAPIEFALMAKTSVDSEVFDNSLCSKTCKKNTDSLNSNITDLTDKLNDSENMLYHYKLGLSQVEGRLVDFKNQEIKFCEKIKGLEFSVECKTNIIENLTNELETLKKEKEGLESKLTCFKSASKDLDNLLESQRSDKNKEGLGYSAVPPPPAQVYSPPKKDMSWTGLLEFADNTITDYTRPSPNVESNQDDLQNNSSSASEKGESTGSILSKPEIKFVKPADNSTVVKIDKKETVRKPTIKYAKLYRKTSQRSNWLLLAHDWQSDYEPYDGGYVSFGKGGCKITSKGTIKTGKLEFENVYFVKDLKRLGHLNIKTMNRLVRHNLVRGLPSKCFENGHTCVACLKEKKHKASCKTMWVNSVTKPLHTLHMDLFGPTFVSSLNHKWYCLVVTDDFSRFTWTFFLKTKDETSGILRNFITEIENLKELRLNIIKCDNGGEFRNKEMNDFCSRKVIKREFSNARTPQQNRVAERRNRTLIEAARTMLADAKLLVTFWAEAVNTACYVQNKVLVNKTQNKTSYELFNGRTHAIGFLIPFGCHVMILNTLDNLGKFKAKGDEGSKEAAGQDVKKDVSSLRYIVLPNWFHEAHLETSTRNAQDACNADTPESSGNSNPTATLTNPLADHMETLAVETPIPTVSSSVPTACLNDSPKPLSDTRLISKRVTNQDDTPSLDNILTLTNRFEDIHGVTTNTDDTNGVEANLDLSWVEAMQEELLQFKIQNVWYLVDCPKGEEGIDYDEVFSHVARIEAIRLFLAYASFIGFTVYQMDVKSAFLYGTINEEVEFEALMHEKFQMSAMGELNFFLRLQVLKKEDGILFSQDRHQVTPKECHLHAVKRIFRYLKGHPKLGLWYPKESPFDLVAYSDSDYGSATQDHKSTTGGCQFLGRRLISWQCKKQTIMATSTTEAEYVAAASGCGQVL